MSPTAVGYPPTAVRYSPTAVGYPPTAIGYSPTAVGYSPIAVGYPPTAVGYSPTAVGYSPTAVGYPPTAVGYSPTAVGYPLSAISWSRADFADHRTHQLRFFKLKHPLPPPQVKGICQYPEISNDPRNVFPRRVKTRPEDKFVHKQFVVSGRVFEFGPLLVQAKRPEGATPNLPIDNQETLRISNTGMYEAALSFCFRDEPTNSFQLQTRQMVLQPEETMDLTLWAFPERLGLIENAIIATIKDNPEPVRFDISCYGSKPEVEVDGTQKVPASAAPKEAGTELCPPPPPCPLAPPTPSPPTPPPPFRNVVIL